MNCFLKIFIKTLSVGVSLGHKLVKFGMPNSFG